MRKVQQNSIPKIRLVRDPDTGEIVPEIWKDIKGYEGHYQISNYGRVLSKRTILRRAIKKDGYAYVNLSLKDIHKTVSVHRLVALAFICNLMGKPQVNHKDGDKANNNFINLEWNTGSENQQHAFRNRLNIGKKGEQCGSSKLTGKQVASIRLVIANAASTQTALANKYGLDQSNISKIVNRKSWKHI